MKYIRSIITLGCLAAVAATSGAQGFRSGTGITDIMRAGPRLGLDHFIHAIVFEVAVEIALLGPQAERLVPRDPHQAPGFRVGITRYDRRPRKHRCEYGDRYGQVRHSA